MNVQATIWGLESIQKDVIDYESESIKEAIRLLKEQKSEIEKLRFTIKTVIDLQLDFSKDNTENVKIIIPDEQKVAMERLYKKNQELADDGKEGKNGV
ncbi:MAG: hypothetical protein KAX28_13995 [Candidatus Marinimicrobia bacterium]|nr:hypothetical protein [Candidatus Neomarinimicrobiota bacterium]